MRCDAQHALSKYADFLMLPGNMIKSLKISKLDRVTLGGSVTPPFDGTLCILAVTGGGGDTFDCYTVSSSVTSLQDGGTSFTGLWLISNSYVRYSFGDNFDEYAVGPTGPMAGGEGFTNAWYVL